MKKQQLQEILKDLRAAKFAEDVFGALQPPGTKKELLAAHRDLISPVHPDHFHGKPELTKLAEEIFKKYGEWLEIAKDRLKLGVYGRRDAIKPVTLNTKAGAYVLQGLLATGDIADIYYGEVDRKPVLVKVTRTPANNDLTMAEATNLRALLDKLDKAKNAKPVLFVPRLLASFELLQGKARQRVNVFAREDGYVTLAAIIKAFPNGIDPRDMAWMWNRMLGAVVGANAAGIVHGAITPEHILLRPDDHAGMLVDWAYSVKEGGVVKAIVPKYRVFYPPEIVAKKPVNSGSDLFMLARCMNAVLGPQKVPGSIRGLLRACLLGARHRQVDPYELFEEFGQVLRTLYGPPKFRPFQNAAVAGITTRDIT